MVRFSTYAGIFAAALGVQAENTPPPVPQDAQIGLLNFEVTCGLIDALNYTFNAVFTAVAPVTYGSGQEIYYTDVVGTITIPAAIIDFAPIVGAKYATAEADIHLNLTNASPSDFTAFDGTITNISIPSSGDAKVRIPGGTGTLPPIGPVTLGEAGVAHRILLGEVTVNVQLQNETYGNVGPLIPVTCGQQTVDFVIGSIDVDNTTGPPFAPSNGFVPEFPPTPPLYQSGSFRFPYPCDFGPLGHQTVDLIIGGSLPVYFNPGEQFSLNASQAFLYAPEVLIGSISTAFPNASTLEIDVSEFQVVWENASPSPFNVAANGISTTVSVVGANSNFTIPIPTDGYLTIGPFTAGADNTFAAIAVGDSSFRATLKDDEGHSLYSFAGTCSPASYLELIAVPITTNTVPIYVYGVNTAPTATSSAAATSSSAGLFAGLF